MSNATSCSNDSFWQRNNSQGTNRIFYARAQQSYASKWKQRQFVQLEPHLARRRKNWWTVDSVIVIVLSTETTFTRFILNSQVHIIGIALSVSKTSRTHFIIRMLCLTTYAQNRIFPSKRLATSNRKRLNRTKRRSFCVCGHKQTHKKV